MTKTPKLGNDPFSGLGWIAKTDKESVQKQNPVPEAENQQDSKPVKRQNSKPVKRQDAKPAKQQVSAVPDNNDSKLLLKKVTYYITPDHDKRLKLLSVELERDLSDLIREAIEGLQKKYADK